jgi:hypothetical protein
MYFMIVRFIAIFLLVSSFAANGQAPNKFNYQGVARDAAGSPIASTSIGLRLSIHDGSALGATVYQETHLVTTNAFGLYNVAIGGGTVTGGSGAFSAISWGTGDKYIQVEIDPSGGSTYVNLGTSQLLSVPYALYAANGGGGGSYTAGTGISITGATINAQNGSALWNANQLQGVGISTVTPTTGQVLSYNGSNWQPTATAGSGWSLTGNAGTSAGTNFIGTTDTQSLVIKVNNQRSAKIDWAAYSPTSFGYQALNVNTANTNTGFGYQALKLNTIGSGNVAMGTYALTSNIVGEYNTAIGSQSLYNNIDSYNTAVGTQTLMNNTTGFWNTAIGNQALYFNTTGSRNVSVGGSSLGNTTGSYNVGVGWATLSNNSTGNYNTAIGYNANMFGCCPNLSNTMELGYNSGVTSSNSVAIGNSSISSITAQVAITVVSDERVKSNIQSNVPGLKFITALNPVTYHYDIRKENLILGVNDSSNWEGKYDIERVTFSGFLAQDVDRIANQIGYQFSGVDKANKVWGIKYTDFIPSIVKSIQELDEKISVQQQLIDELKKELNELKTNNSKNLK